MRGVIRKVSEDNRLTDGSVWNSRNNCKFHSNSSADILNISIIIPIDSRLERFSEVSAPSCRTFNKQYHKLFRNNRTTHRHCCYVIAYHIIYLCSTCRAIDMKHTLSSYWNFSASLDCGVHADMRFVNKQEQSQQRLRKLQSHQNDQSYSLTAKIFKHLFLSLFLPLHSYFDVFLSNEFFK